jgi:hypothetical protein
MFLSLIPVSVHAQSVSRVPVNIFGDGDPANGIEDGREQVMGRRSADSNLSPRYMNAGTVKCDGKIRGTAMVVDTREFGPGLKGVVLASAAHVLYDLDSSQRYRRCEFHFLALTELSRYQAKIDMNRVKEGGFDPLNETGSPEFGEGDWAFLYVPKPWKNFNPIETITLQDFSFLQMETFQQSGGELKLIAFYTSAGVISISTNCSVVVSGSDGLGGGRWKGQLLDDCDSAGGSSGGGIIAVQKDKQYLIGIRNGSHWSEKLYPASDYPLGPPDGSVWDRRVNTNFARAIDSGILQALEIFVQELKEHQARF